MIPETIEVNIKDQEYLLTSSLMLVQMKMDEGPGREKLERALRDALMSISQVTGGPSVQNLNQTPPLLKV